MRAVVQRVSSARVVVDGQTVGEIAGGLLALVGATHDDTADDARAVARKIAGLRIFSDSDGKMNLSVTDTGERRWWSASSLCMVTSGRVAVRPS